MPRLPGCMLRSNAARASASGNTESTSERSSPRIGEAADLDELLAVGLDDEVDAVARRLLRDRHEPPAFAEDRG